MSAANLVRDFPERLLLHVASARNVAPRNSDGSGSDPYCVVYYGDKKEKTKSVAKTLNPHWNESFVFTVDPRITSLKLEIFDLGTLRDEHMGEAIVDLKPIVSGHRAFSSWVPLVKGSSKKPVTGDIQISVCASSIGELLRKDANTPAEELKTDIRTLENHFLGSSFDPHLVSSQMKLGKSSFTFPSRVVLSQVAPHVIPVEYMPIGAEKDRKSVTIMMWVYTLSQPVEPSVLFKCGLGGGGFCYSHSRSTLWWTEASGANSLGGGIQPGRWTHLAITFTASPRVCLDGVVQTITLNQTLDPASILRSPLSLGGPITPRVFPTPGTAVWALVDNVSIVLGDITPEEIKASLDSSAPVDVVPSVLSGGAPQDYPILRTIPSVASKFIIYLAQLCEHRDEGVRAEAKRLANLLGTKINALLATQLQGHATVRFVQGKSWQPMKEAAGVMAMATHGATTIVANAKGIVSVFNKEGSQIMTKALHEGRIHGVVVAADAIWTAAEDNRVVVTRASGAYPVLCTLKEHGAMIRAIALVTHGDEQRVWTGDVAGVVNLWDPFGLDWEQISAAAGAQAPVIPHTPLPVSAKELEGLACICQVNSSVWLGTRKSIIVYDLKTQGVTRTISMAYAPNKLLHVPNSGVWCASAAPDIQIFDDVGEKINTVKGHTAKILSLYYWSQRSIVFSGGFDTTIFAWHPETLSCIAEIKGRHKDGIRAIIAPEESDGIWTGGDDKDTGIQQYSAVEQGMELASFAGMLLPYVLILSRAAGVELLELFCKVSKSWDLNTDLCRAILPSFVGSFSSTVSGGAVYDRWTACYIFLLNKIPANYTAQFYPSVLKDLCTIASTSQSFELRKLSIEALGTLAKNKGNRDQIMRTLAPVNVGATKLFTMMAEIPDAEARNVLWDLARDHITGIVAVPSTLARDLGPLRKSAKFADVCFYPGGNKQNSVFGHRVIIGARCKPLGQLIAAECANLPPGSMADVRLPDVSPDLFECIMQSIYGDAAPRLPSGVDDLLALMTRAKSWGLDELAVLCISRIRGEKKKPTDLVKLIVHARDMPETPLSKQLIDGCTAELMAVKYSDIQNVDLTPLGKPYLATLFKRLRRKEPPQLSAYEEPNMSLNFARDFNSLGLEYSDFKIRTSDEVFMSYRCLLYARSHYFQKMFDSPDAPAEISVNVRAPVMRVLHTFLLSDAPSLNSFDNDASLAFELLAALEVFQPENDNCLTATLAFIRAQRGEQHPVSAAATAPKAIPAPLCKNRHPCSWASGGTYNCDKCHASGLSVNPRWQCRACDWDYCVNCVPASGDPTGNLSVVRPTPNQRDNVDLDILTEILRNAD